MAADSGGGGFQSTFPRGERPACWRRLRQSANFNPRSRVGNDEEQDKIDRETKKFQSTFPRGERRRADRGGRKPKGHFNPRSRVGNDNALAHIHRAYIISIHVPAWGTTWWPRTSTPQPGNFNPRSRVGNDERCHRKSLGMAKFQSTFPRGERQVQLLRAGGADKISIHVPAWGTTGHPCGASCTDHFNPRSRVGNDRAGGLDLRSIEISIHVPAWGTT